MRQIAAELVCHDLQDQAKKDRNFLRSKQELLFQKMSIQLKEQRFEDIMQIQVGWQVGLDSIMTWQFQRCS
jgi:hypothetical protein